MRDPARIEPMIAKVLAIWRKNPDMRLMQVLGNTYGNIDPYYIEDDQLDRALDVTYPLNKSMYGL